MTLKSVAVVGHNDTGTDQSQASGALGQYIVEALLQAAFRVTAITRESSNAVFHAAVDVRRVDPSSPESLVKAFSGQDAVIMAIATSESGNQHLYIDSAVAAGVKRFIPAEWGANTRPGKLSGPLADMLSGKTRTVDHLIEQVKLHPGFTWTGIATSAFLDWGLDHGVFGINLAAKTALIFDSGNEPVSASTLPFIAQSTVSVLQRADETANKYYEVAEYSVTQNELLRLFEQETGVKFTVSRITSEAVAKSRDEKIAKGDMSAFMDVLWLHNFADGAGHAVRQEDIANPELGLVVGDLGEFVREHVKSRTA